MPRPRRQLADHSCYHLMARGNNRQIVFADEEDHRYFLRHLGDAKARYPAKLYHYCLMPTHIHLLLEIDRGDELPKLMQALLQSYGRWYQKRREYVGHVWQGRYKSPLVIRESYFLEAGRYIERNPLRAGMVPDLRGYPWSSYHYYAYGKRDPLLDEDPYYLQLGPDAVQRQVAYRDFMRLTSPYDGVLDGAFLETPF